MAPRREMILGIMVLKSRGGGKNERGLEIKCTKYWREVFLLWIHTNSWVSRGKKKIQFARCTDDLGGLEKEKRKYNLLLVQTTLGTTFE